MAVVVEEHQRPSISTSALSFLTDNAIGTALSDTYATLSEKRKTLGLTNPGTVEDIARSQKDVFTTNYMMSGLRCDLRKVFSLSPTFQLSHSFAMTGSQGMPPWQLMTMYGNSRVFMRAAYSSDKSLMAWGNLRWTPRFVTKTETRIDPRQAGTIVQIDNEYTGDDFTASVKAVTPSLMEGGLTGIMIGSYLQSITPRFALGFEGVWQRSAMNSKPDTLMSYCGRYKGDDWIAVAQLMAQGALGLTYWRQLTEKVEVGADMSLQFAPGAGGRGMFGGIHREGTTSVAVKYNFANAVYRAQVDSQGRFGVILEKRVAPPVTVTFSAEIDQWKNTHRLGLGVALESAPEELNEFAERGEVRDQLPPPY